MTYIPTQEIKVSSFHTDTIGVTFIWRGHFLRGIFDQSVPRVKRLFNSGFINEICCLNLFPRTWVSEFENEQFGMIVEHELLFPIILATEWNAAMLKDAALVVLNIANISKKYGFNMYDCHKLNVLFHNNTPYYVDLGSFIPEEKGSSAWKPYISFMQSYYYIIDIWTHGSPNIAKSLMYPEKELASFDYFCYKYRFFRHLPSLANLIINLRRRNHKIAYSGFTSINTLVQKGDKTKAKIVKCQKIIINIIKPLPSQNITRILKKVYQQKIAQETCSDNSKMDNPILSALHFYESEINSVTIIGHSTTTFLTKIAEIPYLKSIISICSQDTLSSGEYYYSQNNNIKVNSVSFDIVKRLVAFNNTPESRLSSDIVIVFQLDFYKEVFGPNNTINYLNTCMKYSNTNTIIVYFNNDEFLYSLIQQRFDVLFQQIIENELLLVLRLDEKKRKPLTNEE